MVRVGKGCVMVMHDTVKRTLVRWVTLVVVMVRVRVGKGGVMVMMLSREPF